VIVAEDYSVRIIGLASQIAHGTIADDLLRGVRRAD